MLTATRTSFDLDRFVADCRAALGEDVAQKAVREVLVRALEGSGLRDTLGQPKRGGTRRCITRPISPSSTSPGRRR